MKLSMNFRVPDQGTASSDQTPGGIALRNANLKTPPMIIMTIIYLLSNINPLILVYRVVD